MAVDAADAGASSITNLQRRAPQAGPLAGSYSAGAVALAAFKNEPDIFPVAKGPMAFDARPHGSLVLDAESNLTTPFSPKY